MLVLLSILFLFVYSLADVYLFKQSCVYMNLKLMANWGFILGIDYAPTCDQLYLDSFMSLMEVYYSIVLEIIVLMFVLMFAWLDLQECWHQAFTWERTTAGVTHIGLSCGGQALA